MPVRRTRWPAVLAVTILLAGCSGGTDAGDTAAQTLPSPDATSAPGTAPATSTTGAPAPAPTGSPPTTAPTATAAPAPSGPPRLVQVARLEQPLAMAAPADGALYVAEKTGRVRVIRNGRVDPSPVLDLSGEVADGFEQGLLGLVFSADQRQLYVNYTDRAGDGHVVEMPFENGRADPDRRRELLFFDDPYPNHNGGHLTFGPDGLLYVGMGDGGSRGDPQGNAQRLDTLFGKMLRIDPRPSGGLPYTIPPGNPFVGRAGARPEIWAYGLRNPWRYSFDRATGDLWIADVGQNQVEELSRVPATSRGGENYGWDRLEGTSPFEGEAPEGTTAPVYEYSHDDGSCSVTGGYAYRGARLPGLQGAFLFGDYCVGELYRLDPAGGQTSGQWQPRPLGLRVDQLSSFGQDQAGELYALSLDGAVYRLDPS